MGGSHSFDITNDTEMVNIHARVLAWRYVLSSLGYTLKSHGVTFNIFQDLPNGTLKQVHHFTVPPASFPRPCSLCGCWVLCGVFFFYDSHITGNDALFHAVLSPSNL